jgi:2-polyprenyl-6-methoxyphenol hydroxylase-like FAD-dependent oxidoreductase
LTAQVIIVGAGPVGQFMAASLARLDVAVRIVDKAAVPSDRSKALVIWPRTLKTFDIHGAVEPFLAEGLKITDVHLMAQRRSLARASLRHLPGAYPFALFLAQSDTERLLAADLLRLGVTVERAVELTGFTAADSHVTAVLAHPDGRTETVETDWLVGCDGAHSAVRHGLDLPFDGETMTSNWVLADLMLDGPAAEEVLISWHPGGVLALFPMGHGRFRVIADVPAADGEVTLDEVQRLLDTRGPGGLTGRDPYWLNRFKINERKVAHYRAGRVFVAGDAAHIHSPAGGQGMNTGLQDAANLAWKLALVCRGKAHDRILDSYSPERGTIGDQVLRNAGRMTRIAIVRTPWLQSIRNAVVGMVGSFPAFQRRLTGDLSELDLYYGDSPLNGPSIGRAAALDAGDRAPDCPLVGAPARQKRLFEKLRGGRFVLLSGETPPMLPDTLADLVQAAQFGAGTEVYRPEVLYLIRPDGYVAMTAPAAQPEAVIRYLSRLLA